MNDIPEGAVAMAVRLSGEAREMVLAGFKLGIDYAANVIKVCSDDQTNEAMADATPRQCFELAEMLIRNQGAETITQLAAGADWPTLPPTN
ncbi:hypothetical protein [Mycobacteroides abscessus]|uniref:hypothetical protein n=1 Tax=Mycobacteroides abscessus TaxID=36809 RepID=UPI000C25B23F|nr:hypothetical protein [Mycobacteroides abscessus]RIS70539.1 hypothetical protein D2E54_24315 [Mycobacteroides abscessus]